MSIQAIPRNPGDGRRRTEAGYTLVGLLIVVTVVNVTLGVAMSSWVTIDRRAKEAELIWRGEQIALALDCFRREHPSDQPDDLEALVDGDCLRREYGDPMVKGGEWRILTTQDLMDGTVAQLMGVATEAEAGGAPGLGSGSGAFTRPGTGAAPGGPSQGGVGPARPGQSGGLLGQSAGLAGRSFGLRGLSPAGSAGGVGSGAGGMIGVVSRSQGSSLRVYQGRRKHGEWVFLASGS